MGVPVVEFERVNDRRGLSTFGIGAAAGMAVLALMQGRMASGRVPSIGMSGLAAGCGVLAFCTVPACRRPCRASRRS